jgi:hypothetical protein
MSEIKISTESIGKALIYTALIVVILFAVAVGCYSAGRLQGQEAAPIVVPAAAQPVTVATPSSYPYVLTFTVLSTTTSNGAYEVFTTTGQHLYLQDYYTWDTMYPRDTYTGTITGQNDAAFTIVDVHLMSRYYGRQPTDYWRPYGNSMTGDYNRVSIRDDNRVDTHRKLQW